MRYLITGGSGYIGGRLTSLLAEREETEQIVNVDLRSPASPSAKSTFVRADVRDRGAIQSLLEREKIDKLIHLAFILNPIRDEDAMYDVDVNGCAAVLAAAAAAGTEHVLVTSSTTAYGAFADNPRPIAEDWPVRGVADFSYAKHKADADRVCQLWAAENPERTMTIVRPCIVFGPNVDNYIVRAWESLPYTPVLDGVEEEFQLVHEDDLVSALVGLLDAGAGGAFNVAGDGTIKWADAGRMLGLRTPKLPFRLVYWMNKWAWRLHAPNTESPPGNLHFIRHPWVVSNEKLKATIGWEPQHTTLETFEITMRARGAEFAAPPVPAAPTAA